MKEGAALNSVEDFKGQAMKWAKPAKGRYYELMGNGKLFATLKWEGPLGSLATGRTSAGDYTFKRAGFLLPHVTIRKLGVEQEIGILKMAFSGHGLLELADGRRFSLVKTGFWKPEWSFDDENGRRLCTFRMASKLSGFQADVQLQPAVNTPTLALLLIIGWYVMILQAEEAASASAGGAWFVIMNPPAH